MAKDVPLRHNGFVTSNRADEADELLSGIQSLVIDFIHKADDESGPAVSYKNGFSNVHGNTPSTTSLVESHDPKDLTKLLNFHLPPPSPSSPSHGPNRDGLFSLVEQILKYSVNTWHQGFLSKLYSTPTPVGLAADLLLTALNTNLHVYQVSPVLTLIEKETARALAAMFYDAGGRTDHLVNMGGVSQPGGSAANQTSLTIARHVLFPSTKLDGLGATRYVLFTSAHGHYSLEKAAQISGLGSSAVRSVKVDSDGRMDPADLQSAIDAARAKGEVPFYVNATAGTTVLGSFDPFSEIASICRKERLWFHVDASWGGGIVFSPKQKKKLRGIHEADSITICPHKMLNIPVTCSFLLGKDLERFHQGMTLPAAYLFHSPSPETSKYSQIPDKKPQPREFYDLADLTPQCGRRGDSLKLALTWVYHGTQHLSSNIDHAFSIAAYTAQEILDRHPKGSYILVSSNPPPCLQICFYYIPSSSSNKQARQIKTDTELAEEAKKNSWYTAEICRQLVPRGYMIDYAPGAQGSFLRVVVNTYTKKTTIDDLLQAVEEIGETL